MLRTRSSCLPVIIPQGAAPLIRPTPRRMHTARPLRSQTKRRCTQIYAQDPAYRPSDTAYLAEHFDISVVADPEGFKALNGNTFVVSVSPNVPVRQIALDMTEDSHGPAGFFCDHIGSDGLDGDGKVYSDAHYTTCNSSPGLWKYKQESHCMEHDDRKGMDCFGNIGLYLKKFE
jgi:hypothetical protein